MTVSQKKLIKTELIRIAKYILSRNDIWLDEFVTTAIESNGVQYMKLAGSTTDPGTLDRVNLQIYIELIPRTVMEKPITKEK